TILFFKRYILQGEWTTRTIATLRKRLFNLSGRLVSRSGRMVMRIIKGFKEVEFLNSIREKLISFYQRLNPVPL
ncbi:MAG: hypothetical protein DRG25_03240, partial [Deltaproteobacteria bacterium]